MGIVGRPHHVLDTEPVMAWMRSRIDPSLSSVVPLIFNASDIRNQREAYFYAVDPAAGEMLVTGAAGFLGRAVVTALAEDGMIVRAAVRSDPNPPFKADIEVVKHPDLAQPIDWRPLLEGTDIVIHLAGIAHITTSLGPALYDRVNHLATAQAAATAAQRGIRRFVFVSSIRAQSGPASNHALTERDPPTPSDAYGRSKLAAEAAVALSGVPFTILRPVLLYGPGVKGNLATLLRAARSPCCPPWADRRR